MDNGSDHFGINQDPYEVRHSEIQHTLSHIISTLDQMNFRNQVQPRRIRVSPSYPTNMCSMPQYDSYGYSNMADPYSGACNSGWWEHPNCNYRGRTENFHQFQPELPIASGFGEEDYKHHSLEEMVKNLVTTTQEMMKANQQFQQFQQETTDSIQDMRNQLNQLATSLNNLEDQCELPIESVIDPVQNVNAITLKNDDELPAPDNSNVARHGLDVINKTITEAPKPFFRFDDIPFPRRLTGFGREDAYEIMEDFVKLLETEFEENTELEEDAINAANNKVDTQVLNFEPISVCMDDLFCPEKLVECIRGEHEKDMMETFRKIEVHTPLLNSIDHEPKYVEFLKEFCTKKKRAPRTNVVDDPENVAAMIHKKLPPKKKDPGMFTIPCMIGNAKIKTAMLDLGASINVMPLSIYKLLNLGPMKETRGVIQLANHSRTHPKGIVDDVLVQVDNLIFPTDFYIMDIDGEDSRHPSLILLGRPFLSTAGAKIDVLNGEISFEVEEEMVHFNIEPG